MKQTLISVLKLLGLYNNPVVPESVKKNFLSLSEANAAILKTAVIDIFFFGKEADITRPENVEDYDAHSYGRLKNFRARHIPFLDAVVQLSGKKILEIGCGSGCSIVALAEQGATAYGIDVHEPSLSVANLRAKLYGLENKISTKKCNAADVDKEFDADTFDLVIFFASMEHMTHQERIAALKAAWKVTKKGGSVCILGTPNRLWFYDTHTSQLPFYMWLPDDLAFDYSKFSTRHHFNALSQNKYEDMKETFSRWGRGVSFHEIDLAIKPSAQIKVLADLHSFERSKKFIQRMLYKRTDEYKFKKILAAQGPAGINPGFYEYYLDIIMQKDN